MPAGQVDGCSVPVTIFLSLLLLPMPALWANYRVCGYFRASERLGMRALTVALVCVFASCERPISSGWWPGCAYAHDDRERLHCRELLNLYNTVICRCGWVEAQHVCDVGLRHGASRTAACSLLPSTGSTKVAQRAQAQRADWPVQPLVNL
eukprot:914471-Pleurochrysis_carterae.AAC.3